MQFNVISGYCIIRSPYVVLSFLWRQTLWKSRMQIIISSRQICFAQKAQRLDNLT